MVDSRPIPPSSERVVTTGAIHVWLSRLDETILSSYSHSSFFLSSSSSFHSFFIFLFSLLIFLMMMAIPRAKTYGDIILLSSDLRVRRPLGIPTSKEIYLLSITKMWVQFQLGLRLVISLNPIGHVLYSLQKLKSV